MRWIISLVVLSLPVVSFAAEPNGRWKTETGDGGAYLLVDIGSCASDAAKLCGKITKAVNTETQSIVGRNMILDMQPDGANEWSGGTIWAPDDDKTYRATMSLKGDVLTVKGCVLGGLICRGQDWTRQ